MRRLVLGSAFALLMLFSARADAAQITATNLLSPSQELWTYEIAMNSAVTTLTVERADDTHFRVKEAGDSLSFNVPTGAPCVRDPADTVSVICKNGVSASVTNSGGSANPPVRDVVIVRGPAHGDAPSTWPSIAVGVTQTGGLMELWAGQSGGSFTGSDIAVGTVAQPADIYHSGGSSTSASCFSTCDLKAGADVLDGGPGGDRVTGGAGDDRLVGGDGDDQLDGGPGNDFIAPGANKDTSTGGEGTDTLSYDDAARPAGLTTTFAAGTAGTLGALPYDRTTLTIGPQDGIDRYDATFEDFVGTPLDDRLTGGDLGDAIDGAGGNDVIRGGKGPDQLSGGAGNDVVDYTDRTAPITAALGGGASGNADDGAGDSLSAFEGVLGGAGSDTLTGAGADESFDGGAGADRIDGGGGTDTVTYPGRAAGVTVTVGSGADDGNDVDGPPGARDDVSGIEIVRGTAFNDTLIGDDASGALVGLGGDDLLDGRGGADLLDGGDGRDLASFASRSTGADVSLPAGTGPDGDTLVGIEDLTGGPGDDRFTGDDGPNRLDGAGGADTLTGNGAIDDFYGGDGDDVIFARDGLRDTIECGAGSETVDLDTIDLSRDCFAPVVAIPAPTPTPTVAATATLTWKRLSNGKTRIRSLRVAKLVAGDVVSLTCSTKARGCRKAATTKPLTLAKGDSVSFTKAVKDMTLAAGATLVVKVTHANARARIVTFTIVKKKDPKRSQRCLNPGATKTSAC